MTPAALRALADARMMAAARAAGNTGATVMILASQMLHAAADNRWIIVNGISWPSPTRNDPASLLRASNGETDWLEPS